MDWIDLDAAEIPHVRADRAASHVLEGTLRRAVYDAIVDAGRVLLIYALCSLVLGIVAYLWVVGWLTGGCQ